MSAKVGWKVPKDVDERVDELERVGTIIRQGLSEKRRGSALKVFRGRAVPPRALAEVLTEDGMAVLEHCGLLESDGRYLRCPFRAHLVEGVLVFSDPRAPKSRWDENYLDPLWEAPYLLRCFIRNPCSAALDVGCGCGVFSLVMSSFADQVVGVDINPRAIQMSTMNAALNGIRNVSFIHGDLLEPVSGQVFDRIVFNSPTHFEGNQKLGLLFAGEQILARFFSGAVDLLSDTGYCHLNLAMFDYPETKFADRLREWLGPKADSCQVMILELMAKRSWLKKTLWRKGFLTLGYGPARTDYVPFRYDRILRNKPIGAGSDLIQRLLAAQRAESDPDYAEVIKSWSSQ